MPQSLRVNVKFESETEIAFLFSIYMIQYIFVYY